MHSPLGRSGRKMLDAKPAIADRERIDELYLSICGSIGRHSSGEERQARARMGRMHVLSGSVRFRCAIWSGCS